MHQRSPTPPLFPYTTLFRSPASPAPAEPAYLHPHPSSPGPQDPDGTPDKTTDAPCPACAPYLLPKLIRRDRATDRHPQHLRLRRDRKSTRLNSSHVKISYAV